MRGLSWFVGILLISCQTTPHRQGSAIFETPVANKQSVVFIAGYDEGENYYYTNARKHFQQKGMRLVEGVYDLEGILDWLNAHHNYKQYDEVHIVSHSNPWRGMSLKVSASGERITHKSLQAAALPRLAQGIDKETKIIFHSCGMGENSALLEQLREVFTATDAPQLFSSPHFNVFGGKYASHYLAQPYYAFYPTAESKGPLYMAREFQRTYPGLELDWLTVVRTRTEPKLGDAYSYKFNIPVSWTFQFEEESRIPELNTPDQIIDFVLEDEAASSALFELGIPVESFRWRAKRQGHTMVIEGKTTALCVLAPIMDPEEEQTYKFPDLEDQTLYRSM